MFQIRNENVKVNMRSNEIKNSIIKFAVSLLDLLSIYSCYQWRMEKDNYKNKTFNRLKTPYGYKFLTKISFPLSL